MLIVLTLHRLGGPVQTSHWCAAAGSASLPLQNCECHTRCRPIPGRQHLSRDHLRSPGQDRTWDVRPCCPPPCYSVAAQERYTRRYTRRNDTRGAGKIHRRVTNLQQQQKPSGHKRRQLDRRAPSEPLQGVSPLCAPAHVSPIPGSPAPGWPGCRAGGWGPGPPG